MKLGVKILLHRNRKNNSKKAKMVIDSACFKPYNQSCTPQHVVGVI